MRTIILVRFSEIHLKGNNKHFFIKLLRENLRHAIKPIPAHVETIQNRLIVCDYAEEDLNKITNIIRKVFGVYSYSIAVEIDSTLQNIEDYISKCEVEGSFKIDTNRADKTFSMKSFELSAHLGGIVLDNNANAKVDVKKPNTVIHVDIRENGKTYIFDKIIYTYGGMPLGERREGLLLLSGGIDSPVAGYMMAKRGLRQDILHFDSYPYTSVQAKEKVVSLARIIKPFIGCKFMYVVSMTKLQEEFHINCKEEYAIALLRRAMLVVAEKLCDKYNYKAIVTGESLGQVASQTLESLTLTNDACQKYPTLRPLIGFNKDEIIEIAKEIETFETSILPYEDCCTVFLPKNPIIKPKIAIAKREEAKVLYYEIIDNILSNLEIIEI